MSVANETAFIKITSFKRQKAVKDMEVSDMIKEELITTTIDRYAELQRIKKNNGNQENSELDYSIRLAVAKLSSLGVNVEDITL